MKNHEQRVAPIDAVLALAFITGRLDSKRRRHQQIKRINAARERGSKQMKTIRLNGE